MRLSKIFYSQKSKVEFSTNTNFNLRKVLNKYKIFLLIFVSIIIIIISVHFILLKNAKEKLSMQVGNTLPGATEINPSVMYNDTVYSWKQMSGPITKLPQGELPDGYEYVGDIQFVNTGKLERNFQFIAKFSATGKLYYNEDLPDQICICITTDWLDNAYVLFHVKEK